MRAVFLEWLESIIIKAILLLFFKIDGLIVKTLNAAKSNSFPTTRFDDISVQIVDAILCPIVILFGEATTLTTAAMHTSAATIPAVMSTMVYAATNQVNIDADIVIRSPELQ